MLSFIAKYPLRHAGQSVLSRTMSVVVSASSVKELRDKSGAPMMDCKKALAASEGDVSKAMDWLRAKGIARASNNADRLALEGLIALHIGKGGKKATLLEINSETDFVSRNKDFQRFCAMVTSTAAQSGVTDIAQLMTQPCAGSSSSTPAVLTLQSALGDIINLIRENIVIKRIEAVHATEGTVVAGYVHGKVDGWGDAGADGGSLHMGKTVAVVTMAQLPGSADHSESGLPLMESSGRRVAMHIVAAKPSFLSEVTVPADFMQREGDIIAQQMQGSNALQGKTADVAAKIVKGKVQKRLAEVCLLSQVHVAEEGGVSVGKFLAAVPVGKGLTCVGFKRWAVGGQ